MQQLLPNPHDMNYLNKGEIRNTLNTLREQKFSYYEEKDKLLATYFEPTCIHKAQHFTREFEYVHNKEYKFYLL